MEVLIFSLIFSIMIGVWADRLDRNGFGWFALALLISPLITALILLVVGKDTETKENT